MGVGCVLSAGRQQFAIAVMWAHRCREAWGWNSLLWDVRLSLCAEDD